MPVRSRAITPVLLLATAASTCSATDAADARFTEWWQRIRTFDGCFAEGNPVHLRWTTRPAQLPTDEEIEELRARIAPYPMHPDRSRLAQLEHTRRTGGVGGHEVWRDGRMWRYNIGAHSGEGAFYDRGQLDNTDWSMDATGTVRDEPERDPDNPAAPPRGETDYEIWIFGIHAGVLASPVLRGVDIPPPVVVEGAWSLDHQTAISKELRVRIVARGRYDANLGHGRVEYSALYFPDRDADGPSTRVEASNWAPSWCDGLLAARRLRLFSKLAEGRVLDQIVEVQRMDRIDRSVVSAFAAPPVPGQPDAIRTAIIARREDAPGTETVEEHRASERADPKSGAPWAARAALGVVVVAVVAFVMFRLVRR